MGAARSGMHHESAQFLLPVNLVGFFRPNLVRQPGPRPALSAVPLLEETHFNDLAQLDATDRGRESTARAGRAERRAVIMAETLAIPSVP